MTVTISGRLQNRISSGFVRTPPAHAARIARNLLAFPTPPPGQRFNLYDPTCGTGELLQPFLAVRGAQLYGVEISAERIAAARALLPQAHLVEADVAAVSLPKASLSAVIANPPYLQGGELRRLELEILRDAGAALVPGGILVAVLPARQWDGLMAALWLRFYDSVRCWAFPSMPDQPDHEEAFEHFSQIVVAGVRRAAPREEADLAEKQRLRGWRFRPERLEAGKCPWDGGVEPPVLPEQPIPDPYRVPPVGVAAELTIRRADQGQLLSALETWGVQTTAEWSAATTWPAAEAIDRPLMDYTGPAHVAADLLTGLLDGLPVTAPDGDPCLLTTFVAQSWKRYELSEEEQDQEQKKGTVSVSVRQLEDNAILGVLNLRSGAIRYCQKQEVFAFLTSGGWLATLAEQCRARRRPIYQLDPADWQVRLACQIGCDKHLHGAEFPGLSVSQQHRAYALYAGLEGQGHAAIQGEPGTGKTRMLTLLMAQMAERWKQRDQPAFRGQPRPRWVRRLAKAWKANPHTLGAAPRALPILIALPLRTRKGFRRDCQAAWPEAEFVTIADHTDIAAWLRRCAESEAPAVIAILSLSQMKDFGNEWLPAAVERHKTTLAPDLSPELADTCDPWVVGGELAGYHARDSGALVETETISSTFFCPDCGARVEDTPLNIRADGADELVSEPVTSLTYFQLKRRTCRRCGASLNTKARIAARQAKFPQAPFAVWSQGVARAVPDPKRTAGRIIDADGARGPLPPDSLNPYEHLYRRYRGCVALAVVDESHNLCGRDSHVARAGHLAWRAAQTRVASSGTHFAGTLDKFFHYWYRFNPSFWRRLGFGWDDLPKAVQRYGVVQHWVREVEVPARKGGRGQTELREATVPAPGVSARLLPHLLRDLAFITVLDVGAHMPPRVELPELVAMHDPALEEPGVLTDDQTVWRNERNLAGHYRRIEQTLEQTARKREPGCEAARLAQGTVPRWFAALPCVAPSFSVSYSAKDEWGNVTATHTLLRTPVLAWQHHYPLERRLRELVARERAEGRRVMVYYEQQTRSMAQRLAWVLQEHATWTLPERVKAEDREDAIRQAVLDGHEVVLVPYLRVSEGLNLQDVLDTIIWHELPKNLFTLDQASRRVWRLNKREEVRLYYLAYAGTAAHRKLRKLGAQSGAAALFAGNTPDGQLARSVGADRTTLARLSAGLADDADALQSAFQRRNAELAATLGGGRQWLGLADTLPERLRAMHATRAAPPGETALPVRAAQAPTPITAPAPAEPARLRPLPTRPLFGSSYAAARPRRVNASPDVVQRSLFEPPAGGVQLTLFDL